MDMFRVGRAAVPVAVKEVAKMTAEQGGGQMAEFRAYVARTPGTEPWTAIEIACDLPPGDRAALYFVTRRYQNVHDEVEPAERRALMTERESRVILAVDDVIQSVHQVTGERLPEGHWRSGTGYLDDAVLVVGDCLERRRNSLRDCSDATLLAEVRRRGLSLDATPEDAPSGPTRR